MAVRLSGDFERLERLLERAGRIASGDFRKRLLRSMAREVNRQIERGFQEGRDPYGKPWAPLKFRAGKPLVDSGGLQRAAQSARATDTGVMVSIDLVQAKTHQYGTTIRAKPAKALRFRAGGRFIFAKKVTIPPRPFLPDGDLPPVWRDRLADVVDRALRKELRGV